MPDPFYATSLAILRALEDSIRELGGVIEPIAEDSVRAMDWGTFANHEAQLLALKGDLSR